MDSVCNIQFGTRIVKKQTEAGQYYVYGGGGATFTTKSYNRENAITVSRFALSKECTRFIEGKFFLNDSGLTLHPKTNLLLFQFLKWHVFALNDKIYSLARGAAQKNLDVKRFSKLLIKLPKNNEQCTIATELDTLQKMIDGYKAQIADLDVLAQSIFLDMFGDPVSNPKGWEITVLNDLCTKITDGTHLSPKWVDSGIPFIFVANIKNFEINFDVQKYIDEDTYEVLWKSTPIELGDIVYSSVGSYGNPAIVSSPQKFMFQRHIALLKPLHDKINNVYLKWFLISEGGKKQADDSAIGVAQKTLNLKAIKNFHIPVPPIELQQPFASKVEAIEKQKELIRQQLADAETLMKERMQYYFS